MYKFFKLRKILNKEYITIEELRFVANDEHVLSITENRSTKQGYRRFDVVLDSKELHYLYVKINSKK